MLFGKNGHFVGAKPVVVDSHLVDKAVPEAVRMLGIIANQNRSVVEAYLARRLLGAVHSAVDVKVYPFAIVDARNMMPLAVVNVRFAVETAPPVVGNDKART